VGSIRSKGARLAVPGLVDLSEFATEADRVARIVLESVQELLLKLALQMARDDYGPEGPSVRKRTLAYCTQSCGVGLVTVCTPPRRGCQRPLRVLHAK
jgi:hypothetical protein